MDTISAGVISGQADKLKAEREANKEGGGAAGESGAGAEERRLREGRRRLRWSLLIID